ncbi:MAG: nuclease [Pseudomonadota bacterium]
MTVRFPFLILIMASLIGACTGETSSSAQAVAARSTAQTTAQTTAQPIDISNRFTCHVTRVHDGDGPIHCAEGMKIRLTAIAARELDESCRPGHPCPAASGAAAKARLTALADRQRLSCEQTGISYGRVTAWCWRADGLELGCAMVRSGHALPWPKYDPDDRLCRAGSVAAGTINTYADRR